MLTKEDFTNENFDEELVLAVGNRLQTGKFTEAIL